MRSLDTLLAGGTVVDGTGGPTRQADVGIRDGRIVYVGDRRAGAWDEPEAAAVIDVTGFVVSPGFIDIHTHSDLTPLYEPACESKVLQGVTTDVVGNCGYSAYPSRDGREQMLAQHLIGIGGEVPVATFAGFDDYAGALDDVRTAINLVSIVGHSALRIASIRDPFGALDDDGLQEMERLLEESLEQGAAGLSTGLVHPPSGMADSAEIEALAAVCARHSRVYATHARTRSTDPTSPIHEALDVARGTGVRLQYSHIAINNPEAWGRGDELLGLFDSAIGQGLDVMYDVYPYDASASSVMQYLPGWVQAGGLRMLRERAADPSWREEAVRAITAGWYDGIAWDWERVFLSAAQGYDEIVGLSFAEIADRQGIAPERLLLDLCVELGAQAQVVLRYRSEEDIDRFLAHQLSIVASDGLARSLSSGADRPHPRSFGTFPRWLGEYVRNRRVVPLPTAIHKITGAPAARLGLRGRGLITEGAIADLTVFNAETIRDEATIDEPRRAPVGVVRTIVRGETVAVDGTVLPVRPGRFIRCGE